MQGAESNVGTREHRREIARLRDAARHLGVDRLRDGSWFQRIVAGHVKKHLAHVHAMTWDGLYPDLDVEERAALRIQSVARRVAAAGVAASAGTSTGELLSLVTEGLGAPVGLPAAVLSMGIEAAYTSLLQVDMVCDLASIYGVPFDADDMGEVATLFGLAFEVEVGRRTPRPEDEQTLDADGEEGMMEKLLEFEDGEIAKRIGKKLLEESLMRNGIPILGVAISGRWNYVATHRLGKHVRKYLRYRRALLHGCAAIRLEAVSHPAVIVEGAWLLATNDGNVGHEELMALAFVLDQMTEHQRGSIEKDKTFGDDEEEWFDELAKAPASIHEPLLDVLFLVAATNKEVKPSERRFLRRVGKIIGRPIDFDRLGDICRHLAHGEDLPPGTFPGSYVSTSPT
jgi:uncharacterized protein (DUF697 family)/transposase